MHFIRFHITIWSLVKNLYIPAGPASSTVTGIYSTARNASGVSTMLDPRHEFLLGDLQLGANLVEAVHAVEETTDVRYAAFGHGVSHVSLVGVLRVAGLVARRQESVPVVSSLDFEAPSRHPPLVLFFNEHRAGVADPSTLRACLGRTTVRGARRHPRGQLSAA